MSNKNIDPGLQGVLNSIFSSEKAIANSERRMAEANGSHPLNHNAPLHHRIEKRYTIAVYNMTPFVMRMVFKDEGANKCLLESRVPIISPNHRTFFHLGNEFIKGDGCPTFSGQFAWVFETDTSGKGVHEKMNGLMVFGLGWEIAGSQETTWRKWSEEKDSGPFWSKFSSRSERSLDENDFTLEKWWIGFKK